jgi:sterol desaturase/sphingolipid hydroxylase (fatty acid hydroxylase superfamily)
VNAVFDFVTAKPYLLTVALAILWTAQYVSPFYRGRQHQMRHAVLNLGLGLFNWGLVALVFAGATKLALDYSATHTVGVLHHLPSDTPMWLQWVIAFAMMDFWKYLWHRINHRVPLLWRFHAVHHSDSEMDVTSAIRFHTVEILVSAVFLLALNPLFGVSMSQLFAYESAFLFCVMFQHANLKLPLALDRFLRLFIVTPRMHFVHHSDHQPETDSNYTSLFTIWDRLLGTYRVNDDTESITLGLKDHDQHDSQEIMGMLAAPFKKRPNDGSEEASSEPEH